MTNVVCFWSHPEEGKPDIYTEEYVRRLHEAVQRNTTKAEFICYTDRFMDSFTRPLNTTLKGWWAKLTLFARPELINSPTLYIDLDTLIVDNIDHICKYVDGDSLHSTQSPHFTILRDFYRKDGYGSGLMAWNGDYSYLWDEFAKSPGEIINRYGGTMGDQWFIETQVKDANIWQDEFPNEIVSYKLDCKDGLPSGAKIVCFHGEPRPHNVNWKV